MIPRYTLRKRSNRRIRRRRNEPGADPFDTMDDGRQICRNNAAGNRLYRERTLEMRTRQNELCCICGLWMAEDETTFDHERGRTAGNRDDRSMVDGKRINGAGHLRCNNAKGSRKMPYVLQ